MAVDYRERKQVTRNRPKRQSLGFFFFAVGIGLILAFFLGGLSGWLLHQKVAARLAARQAAQATQSGPPAPVQPAPSAATPQPPGPAGSVPTPPLTFYKTLPSGGKALIGSGFNPKREGDPEALKPSPPATPPAAAIQLPKPSAAATPAASPSLPKETAPPPALKGTETSTPPAETKKPAEQKPAGEATARKPAETKPVPDSSAKKAAEPKLAPETAGKKPGEAKPATEAAKKPTEGPRTYCVQVSSYKSKAEAEEARAKLAARGLAAYVVVSAVEDRGVYYRVRIGRRLSQAAAMDLASRAGQGAIAIPEM